MSSGPLLLGRTRSWTDIARLAAALAGGAGIATGLIVLAIRQVSWTNRPGMMISAAAPYLGLAPIAGTALAAVGRQKTLTAAGLATVLLFGATQVPLYIGGPGVSGPNVPLQVLSSNMRYGIADTDQLVDLVRDRDVDVLAVQELTPDAVDRLTESGLDALLPYAILNADWGANGIGLYARFPLTAIDVPGRYENAPVAATMTLVRDDARVPMTVASVHPRAPWPHSTAQWSDELIRMAAWADGLEGPVVLAGDFNATNDHEQMRRFFDAGYLDGASRAGAGYLATYPSDRRFPPLIAIDHVLTRGGPVTTSMSSITIRDTDHRAVLATVAVPY